MTFLVRSKLLLGALFLASLACETGVAIEDGEDCQAYVHEYDCDCACPNGETFTRTATIDEWDSRGGQSNEPEGCNVFTARPLQICGNVSAKTCEWEETKAICAP